MLKLRRLLLLLPAEAVSDVVLFFAVTTFPMITITIGTYDSAA